MSHTDKAKGQRARGSRQSCQATSGLKGKQLNKAASRSVAKLKEQPILLDEILSNSPDHIYVYDREGRYIYASSAGAKALGLQPAEMMGKSWRQLEMPPEIMEPFEARLKEVLTTGKPLRSETGYPTVEGERWYDFILTPLRGSVRKIDFVLAIFRDTTEHKQEQAESMRHQEHLEGLVAERAAELKRGSEQLQLEVAHRREAEDALEHKLELGKAFAAISSRFAANHDIDGAVNASLADLGRLCKARRVSLFVFCEAGTMMDNTHEWCAQGVSSQIDNLKNLPCEMFPWWMEKLRRRDIIRVDDVSDMPAEANSEKEVLESQDIKSLVAFPVFIWGELAGFITFGNVWEARGWRDEDVSTLQMFSEVIGNVLARQRAEKERNELQEYLQLQVERMPIGLIVWDTQFRVQSWNPAAERIFGFTREEALGKHSYGFIVPREAQPHVDNIWHRLLAGDMTAHSINENTTKDGHPIVCDWLNTPLRKSDGTVMGVLSMVQDVTERKAMEKELEIRAQLLDTTTDSVFAYEFDGTLVYVNEVAYRSHGYSRDELMAINRRDLATPEYARLFESRIRQLKERGELTYESVHLRKDGSTMPVEAHARIIELSGRTIVLSVARDITERKLAEERVTHLNSVLRALREINQLITREGDRESLIQKSCDLLVETRGCDEAWIFLVDEKGNVLSIAAASLGEDSAIFRERLRGGDRPQCIRELWAQEGLFLAYDRPGGRHAGCPLADRHGSRGVFRCKLEYEGKIYGMMGVAIVPDMISDKQEQELLLELCGDISFALASIDKEEEHRQMEEQVRGSEAVLAQAQQIAHVGSWELDIKTNKLYWSNELYRICGVDPKRFEVTHEAAVNCAHPNDRELIRRSFAEALYENKLYDIEHRVVRPDGSVRVVNEQASLIFDEDGQPIKMAGISHDVTKQKEAEQALRDSERRYRLVAENTSDLIWATDMDLRPTFLSPSITRLLGYSVEEAMFRSIGEALTPASIKRTERAFAKVLTTRDKKEEEQFTLRGLDLEMKRKDGSTVWAETTVSVVRDVDNRPIGLVGVVRDITERRQAEKALRENNRQLKEALDELRAMQQQLLQQERLGALAQMASGIAHDFNNTLVPIVGLSELALEHPERLHQSEEVKGYFKTIHTAAQDAANIVKRLRQFYRRREEDEILLPVDLNQLVKQASALTEPAWRDQAQARGIILRVEADLQPLPGIMGSETELREVLTNLILNAVDAMAGDGSITLRTRSDAKHVTLEVTDTGVGMSEEVLQHCFEPFFSTKGKRGTGLGLSLVHGIIERHEGAIEVHSQLGKGTTFTIRLPVMTEQAVPGKKKKAQAASRSLHILLVDDELTVCTVVREYLTADRHTVDTASNGVQAWHKFNAGKFDLVITDKAMPDMSGEHVAALIKQKAPKIPVILLTGFAELIHAQGEKPVGVDFVLGKPPTEATLRDAISKVTDGRYRRRAK